MATLPTSMRLLVLTQKVDQGDDVLGFFHRWLEEFAKHVDTLEVVCLYEGAHDLPGNVHVHSLGKERGVSRLKYLFNFYRYIISLPYDAVFVHMNPEYVVLGGWWWRLMGKRVVLWYTHRQVNMKLRLAVLFCSAVATAAPESLRIASKKVRVVGHGIETTRFAQAPLRPLPPTPRIVSVGRLTPIKHLETIIEAVRLLREEGVEATLTLVGATALESDRVYEAILREQAAKLTGGAVEFTGAIPNSRMPQEYARFDIAVNACPTGGIDKAVLESMAAALPTLVANEAFKPYLALHEDELMFEFGDARNLADKIEKLLARTDTELQQFVRASAQKNGDVSAVIERLLALLR